jgi:hypothetical protein
MVRLPDTGSEICQLRPLEDRLEIEFQFVETIADKMQTASHPDQLNERVLNRSACDTAWCRIVFLGGLSR